MIHAAGLLIRLEIDGGVGAANIREIAEAGADTFVAGSAIFNQPDYQAVIDAMRQELEAAAVAVSESVSGARVHRGPIEGFNRIPVSRALLADTETPLSAYNKLASGPHSYLFESVQGGGLGPILHY